MAQPGFQTTFIPKRENVRSHSGRGGGIFIAVGLVILVCTIIVAIGFFTYGKQIEGSIVDKQESLERSQDKFEPGLIQLLADLDLRLMNAENILTGHLAPSKFFRLIESSTLQTIQFDGLSFTIDTEFDLVQLRMSGKGQGYASVALQSDEFEKNPAFINPIFSGLNVDENGDVSFSVDMTLDPTLVQYIDALVPAEIDQTFGTGTIPIAQPPVDSIDSTSSLQTGATSSNDGTVTNDTL